VARAAASIVRGCEAEVLTPRWERCSCASSFVKPWGSLIKVGLVIREFDPDPALRSVIIRASDFQERGVTPVRRSEGPMLASC